MRKGESLKQLNDAVELLGMLEQLAERLNGQADGNPPWGGIKLTLAQAKGLITEAEQQLRRGQPAVDAPEEGAPRAVSPLAGRIQRAPTSSGRIRELVPPNGSDRAAQVENRTAPRSVES